MESPEFDDLLASARQISTILRTVFRDVTDEEFGLETMIRHYPVTALGLAAGAGALAGWWVGRKRRVERGAPDDTPASALRYLEHLLPPGSVDRVRNAIPEPMRDEATAAARTWIDTVLEPRLRQGLDTAAASLAETRFGSILKQVVDHAEQDVDLDDPPA